MNTSSRFVVATHILVVLATDPDRAVKSDFLAFSVNTNAVVVRRILSMLKKAGLVISQTGPEGGTRMCKDPQQISLLDIYHAVDEDELFRFHYGGANRNCPIGDNIKQGLTAVLEDAQNALKSVLANKTLREITKDIMNRSGISEMIKQGYVVAELQKNFIYKLGEFIER